MYSDDSDDYELDYEELGDPETNSDIHQMRCIHKCGKWCVRIGALICILGFVSMLILTILSGICLAKGEGTECPCQSDSECLLFTLLFGGLSGIIILVAAITMGFIFFTPCIRYVQIRYFGFKEEDFFMPRLTPNDMVKRLNDDD